MAKKVTGQIKLQIPAGQANPAPPVGPALTGSFSGKVGWDGKKISTSWKKSGALWQPATANAFQMEESIY